MLTKKETKINGEIYKPKRSISSKIGNEEDEENINSKKLKSRHRKTASSYFLGSYISGNELNKFLQEYKEANDENIDVNNKNFNGNNLIKEKNLNIDKKCEENDINNYLFLEKKVNVNKENENVNENLVCLTNASFYSYSIDDDNDNKSKENYEESSVIIKGGDESSTCNNEIKSNSNIGNNNSNNFMANNPFYELEKNKEKYNKDKSFIPIKNGLKYIKDKDERVTDSYLLALKGGESNIKNGKNPYLSTASIIEEEKSEFIESTSKKQSIITGNRFLKDINFKKKKIENEFNLVKDEKDDIIEKSEDEENKENIDINSNKNLKNVKNSNEINKKNSKKEFDLKWNKIKIQKNKKIEIKKKCLRKNKENLLNSFFNLSCNRSIPNSQKNKTNEEETSKTSGNKKLLTNSTRINNNKNILSDNITQFNLVIKDKINKNNKGRSSANLNPKKRRTYSYNGGYISYLYNQRFNTENNINKTNDKIKLSISKLVNQKQGKNIIYNAYNNTVKNYTSKKKCKLNKTMNGSLLSKIKLNPNMKIPYDKLNKSKAQLNYKNEYHFYKGGINLSKIKKLDNKLLLDLSNHKKSFSITKIRIDKIPKHRKIFSSGGLEDKINQINININKSVTYKKPNPGIKYIENTIEKKNYSQIINQRNKKNIINSKENIRIPTYSDSGTSKVKQKIIYRIINDNKRNNSKKLSKIRKANSGFIKININSDIKRKNELNINISNENQTVIILKDKIKFRKSYEKNEVLNKIKKDMTNSKKNFIIFCERNKKNNENEFIFLGLFKYFENNKRFIKVYGNEEIPNYILLKDINKSNYIIYENKIIQNEENKIQFLFEQLNSLYFSFNSIIICKNKI